MQNNNVKKYISSLLALLLVVSSLTVGLLAYGSDLVTINAVNFPDANWRTVVSQEYDENGDGYLSADERNVYSMSLSGSLEDYCGAGAKITDLTGIEYFTSLRRLYCGGIGLETLDVSTLPNLTQLTCQGNALTSLVLGSSSTLTWVNCASNDLTSIDVSGCPALTRLDCYSNNLSSLNLSAVTELETLACQQNNLTTLDLSPLTKLTSLYCSNNHLWELDLSANKALGEITAYMVGNQSVEADASLSDNVAVIKHSFSADKNVVATSLDYKNDDGDTVLGYNAGMFSTTDAEKIESGFDYQYNTGNDNVAYMQVHINLNTDFCMVRFYLDEGLEQFYTAKMTNRGGSVTLPDMTEEPDCKVFKSWSADGKNIQGDTDIYALWDENHTYEFVSFKDGKIDVKCTVCGEENTIDFMDVFNSQEGDSNYLAGADVVKDGCINAKDYAKLTRE